MGQIRNLSQVTSVREQRDTNRALRWVLYNRRPWSCCYRRGFPSLRQHLSVGAHPETDRVAPGCAEPSRSPQLARILISLCACELRQLARILRAAPVKWNGYKNTSVMLNLMAWVSEGLKRIFHWCDFVVMHPGRDVVRIAAKV